MTPTEQLLAFIGSSDGATDRIRIMKGLFLFTQRVKEGRVQPPPPVFQFDAMNYGPCATDIYSALDSLKNDKLIEELPVPGETWSQYKATPAGKSTCASLMLGDNASAYDLIRRMREWCDKQTFTSLLSSVYHAYPDYAKNSVLPRLRPNG